MNNEIYKSLKQERIDYKEPMELICKAEWVIDNQYYNSYNNTVQLNGHMEYTELEPLVRCGDCIYAEVHEDCAWCGKLKIVIGDSHFYCALGQDWGIV